MLHGKLHMHAGLLSSLLRGHKQVHHVRRGRVWGNAHVLQVLTPKSLPSGWLLTSSKHVFEFSHDGVACIDRAGTKVRRLALP